VIHLKELSFGPFGTDFSFCNWVFLLLSIGLHQRARLMFFLFFVFPCAMPPHLHLRPPLLRCP
jgi:hypothetical protein